MAGEFGVTADEVITLLRQMDVPVRSHLSLLTDDQVARLRARWEREKRARAEKQAAPATTARRRRSSAAAPIAAEPAAAASPDGGIRRRRRSEVVTAPVELEEIEAIPSTTEELPIAAETAIDIEHRGESPATRRLATD